MLGNGDCPKATAWQKLRGAGSGGPLPTFWISLSYFKLARMAEVEPPRFQKGEARHSSSRAGGRGPPPKVQAHPCPRRRSAVPRVAGRRAPPVLCQEMWEAVAAESSDAQGASPAVPPGTVPSLPGLRAAGVETRPHAARVPDLPRPSCLAVAPVSPPGALLPARRSEPLRALSRPPAAPWSGSVFSAHHHVHQLVARVQQPRRPEGAAPAAAGGGDPQLAAPGGEQPPATPGDPRGTAAAGRIPRRGGPQGDGSLASLPATQPGDPAHLSLPPSPGLGGAVSRCHSEAGRGSGPCGVGWDSYYLV